YSRGSADGRNRNCTVAVSKFVWRLEAERGSERSARSACSARRIPENRANRNGSNSVRKYTGRWPGDHFDLSSRREFGQEAGGGLHLEHHDKMGRPFTPGEYPCQRSPELH